MAGSGNDRINQSELARRMDVTRQYISKLVRLGKLTMDSDGLVDYEKAVREIESASDSDQRRAARTRRIRQRQKKEVGAASVPVGTRDKGLKAGELDRMLRVATLKERAAKAQLKELEYAHKSGEYLKKSEVIEDAQKFAEYLSRRMGGLGSRVALQLECDCRRAVEVKEVVDKEVEDSLLIAIKDSKYARVE